MISHENATFINIKIQSFKSKLICPPQNLVDRIWREKPEKPHGMVYIYSTEFAGSFLFRIFRLPTDVILVVWTGESAVSKLEKLKEWVRQQPDSIPSYSMQQKPLGSQMHVATLLTSLSYIGRCQNSCFPSFTINNLSLFAEPARVRYPIRSTLPSVSLRWPLRHHFIC